LRHQLPASFYSYLSFDAGFLEQTKKELDGIPMVDPMKILCNEQDCRIFDESGRPLYIDGEHFTVVGSTRFVERIASQLNTFLDSAPAN